MKGRSRAAGLMLLAALAASALAQVTVRLHEPPPGRINIEDLWWVDITNRDGSTYHRVYLHGEVHERDRGLVYRANSNEFDLPPGLTTKRLRDIRLRDQWYLPGYEAFLYRTGTIPAGEYTLIVTLVPLGVGDTNEMTVKAPGSPRLLSPRDGATLASRESYPLFTWSPPVPRPDRATCELTITQILSGQSKEEAIAANPPWFRQRGLTGSALRYPIRARRLELRQQYAWQVRSFSAGVPGGASEVWSFVIGDTARMLTRDEAIAIILKQVIKPESLDHDVIAFLGREPLGPGDSVSDADDSLRFTGMRGPTWFAWVNDHAMAYFAHPTRYVFVDAYSGKLTVDVREWWPLLNRRPLWVTREEREAGRFIFFSNVSRP